MYTAASYPGSGNIGVSGGTGTVPNTVTINGSFGGSGTPVVICAGTIAFSGNVNNSTFTDVTLVAGTFGFSGNANSFTITPDPSALPDPDAQGNVNGPPVAMYQTGSGTLNLPNNTMNITGAIYAPLGSINFPGNNTGSALVEANTVSISGNNTGDGPLQALPALGQDHLFQ
jgi:hypothetical protein